MKMRLLTGILCSVISLFLMTMKAEAYVYYPQTHTRDEIEKYVLEAEKSLDVDTTYIETPSAKIPYKAGKVSQESLSAALKMMNMFRYIAGVDSVVLYEQYNEYAQAGVVLDEAVGEMNHNPKKPTDMSYEFYDIAYKGTSGSNLYTGGTSRGLTIADGLIGWISDNRNVKPGVGHRIWTLDPNMKKVGFGISENYRAMYVFDSVNSGLCWYSPDTYRNIIWPAAETPLDYFENAKYWSIRTGDDEDESNISISITNQLTKALYTVDKAEITIDSGYAGSDVVVFKSPITTPEDGVTYTVSVSGLKQGDLNYDVHFFQIHKKQYIAQVDPTCTSYGVKAYYKCSCGKYYTDQGCTKEIANLTTWKTGEGRIEKKSHDFSKYVSNENDTHEVVCADCGTVQEGHDNDACSGGTATCTAKAKCSKCKAEYGSLNAHTNTTTTTKPTLSANGKKVTACSVCGKVSSTTTIYYPKTFTMSKTSCEYTGSQIKPTITITDSNGKTVAATNYTVAYGTNKAVGKGTVKVTFKGDYSGTKTVEFNITPKKTTIGTPAIAADGITVKWTANTSGIGYYIYRSVNGADYTKVKTITSNATVSWKDTGATTNGAKYQYKIYSYKTVDGTTYKSPVSSVKTIYFLTKPTVSSAVSASDGITVKWVKNSKATGYYIYRSVNDADYTKVKTVTSNATVSWKDTGAKTNGTKYQYKIYAYKTVSDTTYKSVVSAVKTTYFVSRPTISSLSAGTKAFTVKRGKNSKATGYQIQYSTTSDFSSGNKTVTVTSASTVSKTVSSLTAKKKYYVRIRTYKTVSGTKYYSAWSASKAITTK